MANLDLEQFGLDRAESGEIEVVCEFCSASYNTNPHQFTIKH